jgi:hypothetical protein
VRPVNKPRPLEEPLRVASRGAPRTFEARVSTALQDTIGYYCSFCEMPAYSGKLIASKQRKLSGTPPLDRWEDLLLTCDFCRMHRLGDAIRLSDYLWPDVDATFTLDSGSPFVHTLHQATRLVVDLENGDASPGGALTMPVVEVNEESPEAERARRTLELFQLNSPYYHRSSRTLIVDSAAGIADDRRLALRAEVWTLAERYAGKLRARMRGDSRPLLDNMIQTVAAIAQATGFWSVWMTVLWAELQDPEILRRVLLDVDDRRGYLLTGYQTAPDGGTPPWMIFTGTAVERVGLPSKEQP